MNLARINTYKHFLKRLNHFLHQILFLPTPLLPTATNAQARVNTWPSPALTVRWPAGKPRSSPPVRSLARESTPAWPPRPGTSFYRIGWTARAAWCARPRPWPNSGVRHGGTTTGWPLGTLCDRAKLRDRPKLRDISTGLIATWWRARAKRGQSGGGRWRWWWRGPPARPK
jgi:hypothetical protein